MNSDVVTDRSIALALRVAKEAKSLKKQIVLAVQLTFGRSPTDRELRHLTTYVKQMRVYHKQVKPAPTKYPTEITRSLVEELTGKPFEYTEILPVFENYTPDRKAWDIKPADRAMADLCLLLFNSNEFVFIY